MSLVSILITSYQRSHLLKWNLYSLLRQDIPFPFEVIVLNDGLPDDTENLTNRAPYPILHIIREASLERALEYFADVEEIPEVNKARVENLSAEEKQKLFPYLFSK